MSQNASEESSFTQEEVLNAELAEQPAYLVAQNNYLLRRVVGLRAQNTRLQTEVNRWKKLVNSTVALSESGSVSKKENPST